MGSFVNTRVMPHSEATSKKEAPARLEFVYCVRVEEQPGPQENVAIQSLSQMTVYLPPPTVARRSLDYNPQGEIRGWNSLGKGS